MSTKQISDTDMDILGPNDHAVIPAQPRDTILIGGLDKFAALAGMMAVLGSGYHRGGGSLVETNHMREPETPLLASGYGYGTRYESPKRKAARLAVQEAQERAATKNTKKRSKRKAQSQARKTTRRSR